MIDMNCYNYKLTIFTDNNLWNHIMYERFIRAVDDLYKTAV